MKQTKHKPSKSIAQKVVDTVNCGLSHGLGVQEPGKMCVEAAVCFAFGLPHGDNPPCVGEAVRGFKIKLNDCAWSDDVARAKGMKKLAVAQLGSDALDQMEFGKLCYLGGMQKLMPLVFRKAAPEVKEKDRSEFLNIADECENLETFEEAKKLAKRASASAYAYAYASAYAYAYAYAYAGYRKWFKDNMGDWFLEATAEMGLGVLIEMKSPGCKWLYLCD